MDRMVTKPTVHKIKSHMTAAEMVVFSRTNPDIAKWVISNEAADGAAWG